MKNYLEIKSKGEIQKEAFTMIGASTKAGQTGFIGMYGSGNKYAMAALMRKNIDFYCFGGLEEFRFTTESTKFRGKEFDSILINGEKTSFTKTMGGEDWNDIFAPIREIYSNALDEDDNATMKIVEEDKINPEPGYTKIYIEVNAEVGDFMRNKADYFSKFRGEPDYYNKYGSVYKLQRGKKPTFFRSGIKSASVRGEGIFDYDSSKFTINESRVIPSLWEAKYYVIQNIIKQFDNVDIIDYFIEHYKGSNHSHFEHSVSFGGYDEKFHDAWYDYFKDKEIIILESHELFSDEDKRGRYLITKELVNPLFSQFPDITVLGADTDSKGTVHVKVNRTEEFENTLIDAIDFLSNTNYKSRLPKDRIIKCVKFNHEEVLGQALNGEILLSIKLQDYTMPEVAKIIIEENEHILSGYGDETREFQNHLFNIYFNLLKTTM